MSEFEHKTGTISGWHYNLIGAFRFVYGCQTYHIYLIIFNDESLVHEVSVYSGNDRRDAVLGTKRRIETINERVQTEIGANITTGGNHAGNKENE